LTPVEAGDRLVLSALVAGGLTG
jgi:hypothetical protein